MAVVPYESGVLSSGGQYNSHLFRQQADDQAYQAYQIAHAQASGSGSGGSSSSRSGSTGGYLNAAQSARALAALGGVQSRYQQIADNGILTPYQINLMAGSARQTVNNQTQQAAGNAYRGTGGPDPFLSAAVASRGAAAAGQQYAATRSDLLKQNADSRMTALSGLAGLVPQDISLQEQVALTPEEIASQQAQGLQYSGSRSASGRSRAALGG